MTYLETLKAQRDEYATALETQRSAPGLSWPQSEAHYLDRIEQINRIIASSQQADAADKIAEILRAQGGRVTRLIS